MIEVHLKRVPEGSSEYATVATIAVDDRGSVTTHDPERLIPFGMPVLVASKEGPLEQVDFDDDPSTWARHLGTILRTGYLVPEVVRDDRAALA